jgi:putative endonuclease
MTTLTKEIGDIGEIRAAEWLEQHGFRIMHLNWRKGRYELDIVAMRDEVVHFVEVKSRKRGGLTRPEHAITPAKFHALRRAATAYLEIHKIDLEVQFDLIAAEHAEGEWAVRYIPNAMYSTW